MFGQSNPYEKQQDSGPIIVFRATQEKSSSGTEIPATLAISINFDSTEKQNIAQVETPEGTMYCAYSKPAWYVDGNHQFKIIDVLVLAESEESAIEQFEKAREESEELRLAATKWVSENILPKFKEMPEIILVMGRGDIYDKDRLPNQESDIDLMLFVDFSSSNEGKKDELIKKLRDTLGTQEDAFFRSTFYSIHAKGFSGGSETLVPHTPGKNIQVGLDIISLPDVIEMFNNLEEMGRIKESLNAYALNAILHGEILIETPGSGTFRELQTRIGKKSN